MREVSREETPEQLRNGTNGTLHVGRRKLHPQRKTRGKKSPVSVRMVETEHTDRDVPSLWSPRKSKNAAEVQKCNEVRTFILSDTQKVAHTVQLGRIL